MYCCRRVVELVQEDTKLEAETRQEINAKLEAASWWHGTRNASGLYG